MQIMWDVRTSTWISVKDHDIIDGPPVCKLRGILYLCMFSLYTVLRFYHISDYISYVVCISLHVLVLAVGLD